MAHDIAKIFQSGGSQAVRLPKAFRLRGNAARVRKVGRGILLEPIAETTVDWFGQLDRCNADLIRASSRKQPRTPRRRIDL